METDPCFRIRAFARSDVGKIRSGNEDSLLIANLSEQVRINKNGTLEFISGPCGSLFAVADGMGGAAAGETASRTGVDVFYKEVQWLVRERHGQSDDAVEELLIDAVANANRMVYKLGCENEDFRGMGTTLTAALELNGRLTIAQIGDSRAYLFRDGQVRQLTRDQSLVAQKVLSGELTEESARRHPERNILLQALGIRPEVEIALQSAALRPNDVLMLCSDGLHAQMSSSEIYRAVAESTSPYNACADLVDLANRRGGPDNITVLLIQFLSRK
jgi:serine/threonine protein phosphatase PrpC